MSYSHEQFTHDASTYPAPPLYCVWVEDRRWLHRNKLDANGEEIRNKYGHPEFEWYTEGPTGTGQVRHMATLHKAKSRVSRYTSGYNSGRSTKDKKFQTDWTIAKWVGDKYEVIYSGSAGSFVKANPLFEKPLPKGSGQPPTLKELEAEAIASIINIAS